MTLVPAYGRDYKSKKEVLKDFNDEKDFIIADLFSDGTGRFVNKQQLSAGTTVTIRYQKLTKIAVVKV
jgi:hypothetical protein